MSILAIDIANYQGTPDFAAVHGANIGLVFIKATEGTNYVNPTFAANRAHAHANGVSTGFYHFARSADPIAEADYFCNTVGTLTRGEMVALDWEVTSTDPVTWSLRWLQHVESRLGVKPLIYMNQSTVSGFNWGPVVANNNGLWLAKYDFDANSVPTVAHWPFVAIKQYSDKGSVSGVAGGVDLDVFEGDAATLAKYGFAGVAPVPAPPHPAPAPQPAPGPNDGSSLPTMSFGETSNHVVDLQKFLNAYNWRPALPLLPCTGYFGPSTAAVLHHAGLQLGVQGDADGHNFGPHFKAAFWRIGFRG
jgi:GH25 family lysozyme M1 (1,4-beta-N-acetylmuramidase)